MRLRTRFAPSPTGHLHVGNAYSALICQQWAENHGAELLLRIEDIDHTRCRDVYTRDLVEDLSWLGLTWAGSSRQSEHLASYRKALERLKEMGVIYPCFCTRRRIQVEIANMGLAPHAEDGTDHYPGICRDMGSQQRNQRMRENLFTWRPNTAAAIMRAGEPLNWTDEHGHHHPVHAHVHGDVVIGRKDIGISYHLAVVMDDAEQGITHVIRGNDLKASTGIHRLLQALLDLPSPVYIHHQLLRDSDGHRLAKRYDAPSLRNLREQGVNPRELAEYLLHACNGVWRSEKFLGKNMQLSHH